MATWFKTGLSSSGGTLAESEDFDVSSHGDSNLSMELPVLDTTTSRKPDFQVPWPQGGQHRHSRAPAGIVDVYFSSCFEPGFLLLYRPGWTRTQPPGVELTAAHYHAWLVTDSFHD